MEWWKKMSFPQKLYRMASVSNTGAIQWHETGQSVIINIPKFKEEYLKSGIFFRTFKMDSLVRQLNYYGFKTKTMTRANDHFIECTHPNFKRECPELVSVFRTRRKTKPFFRSEIKTEAISPRFHIKKKKERNLNSSIAGLSMEYQMISTQMESTAVKMESTTMNMESTAMKMESTTMNMESTETKMESQDEWYARKKYKALIKCGLGGSIKIDISNEAQSHHTKASPGVSNIGKQGFQNSDYRITILKYLIESLTQLKKYDIIEEIGFQYPMVGF